jgi:hypothetical protein
MRRVSTKSSSNFKSMLHHMKTHSIVQSFAHCFLTEKNYVCGSSFQHILITFAGRSIGRGGPISDTTPLDVFLCVCVRACVIKLAERLLMASQPFLQGRSKQGEIWRK